MPEASALLRICVRDFAPRSMNALLRGTNYKARAAARKREKKALALIVLSQNRPLPRGLAGLLRAEFVWYWCGQLPDIDGCAARCKLLFDALEDMGAFERGDEQIQELLTRRVRVKHKPQRGFDLTLTKWAPSPHQPTPYLQEY